MYSHETFLTRSILIVTCMLWGFAMSLAQQVILNTKGERIVVYPDGSWRYYEASDSVLLNKKVRKEDVPSGEESPAPFDNASANPVSDADISSLAIRFSTRLDAETEIARQALSKAVSDKFAVEGRLEQAEINKELIEPDLIAALEDEYESLRIAVKEKRSHLKKMEKLSGKARNILTLPVERKPDVLNKLVARYEAYLVKQNIQPAEQLPVVASGKTTRVEAVPEPSPHAGSEPRKAADVRHASAYADLSAYSRKPVPCRVYGKSARGEGITVEKGLLFTHTDDDLRPYFRQKDLVLGYAALHQIEDNVYLEIEFVIASPDARKNFGVLESKSMLRLKLISGIFINLFNARTDRGRIDAYTGDTIYNGYYLLDKESEKMLMKYELDKVRVVWSSGFEDYDIIDVDFLINQFACLRSAVN